MHLLKKPVPKNPTWYDIFDALFSVALFVFLFVVIQGSCFVIAHSVFHWPFTK